MATKKLFAPLIPVAVTGVLFAAVLALWLTNGPGTQAPNPVAIEAEQTFEGEARPADPLGFSFAILPFILAPEAPVTAATAAELTELVTQALGEMAGIRVIAGGEARVFSPQAERPAVQVISGALEVRYVYQARIEGDQSGVQVEAQLADGKTGEILWVETYRSTVDGVLDLFVALTEAIWDEFDMEFSGLL